MERLTKEAIRRALEALAAALPPGAAPRELWVVGGAALVLLYGARETTRDVDAFTLDNAASPELHAAAASVAMKLGLPEDWLNDGAKGEGLGFGWSRVAEPRDLDPVGMAVAAALVEMMAERHGTLPPTWPSTVPAAPRRIYLVRAAESLPRLRRLCEEEGPEPMRRRGLLA